MTPLRFAAIGERPSAFASLRALAEELENELARQVIPMPMPTYAAVFEAMDRGACDAAWCPPLIALELHHCGAAVPLAAAVRSGRADYYAALLSEDARVGIRDLEGRRMAWVAPESAAGFAVPRLHLRSFGIDPDTCFGSTRFAGTHQRAASLLHRGEVDVIATYCHRDRFTGSLLPSLHARGAHVVSVSGPIPSDVIAVRREVPENLRTRLSYAFTAMSVRSIDRLVGMRVEGFRAVDVRHLEPLARLRRYGELAPLRRLLDVPSRTSRASSDLSRAAAWSRAG